MQIRWSPEAESDLAGIAAYIGAENERASRRVVQAILKATRALTHFPYIGRPGRVAGTRELVFSPLPYLAVYRMKGASVEIVRLFHGAQDRRDLR